MKEIAVRFGFMALLLVGVGPLPSLGQGSPPANGSPQAAPPAIPAQKLVGFDWLEAGVWGITQDRRGFMWYITQNALVRFDGYSEKAFQHRVDDPRSLGSGYLTSMIPGLDGELWIGTSEGGLNRFDPMTERFARYPRVENQTADPDSNFVTVLYQDARRSIWVRTGDGALCRFDPAIEAYACLNLDVRDPQTPANSQVTAVVEDSQGFLWIGTRGDGLIRYDRGTDTRLRFVHDPRNLRSLSSDAVRALLIDQEGVLWVGTESGLNRFDYTSSLFRRLSPLLGEAISTLHHDESNAIWVGTWTRRDGRLRPGGLERLDPETGIFAAYPLEDPSAGIVSLYTGRDRVLWILTVVGRVLQLDLGAGIFTQHPEAPFALGNWYEDDRGMLWSWPPGGLRRFDPDLRNIETFTSSSNGFSLETPSRVMLPDRTGAVWAPGRPGLVRFDPETGVLSRYRADEDDPTSLSSDNVTAILEDASGRMWIGLGTGGLDRLNPTSGTFARFNSGIGGPVTALEEDGKEGLWVGSTSGLARLDYRTEEFSQYAHDAADPQSMSPGEIRALHRDPNGILWIGLESGVVDRFDPESTTFRRVLDRRGTGTPPWPPDWIYDLFEGGNGDLWIVGIQSAARLNKASGKLSVVSPREFLPGSEAIQGAFQSRTGRISVFLDRGIASFDPARPTPAPRVAFTDFRLFNKSVVPGPQAPITRQLMAGDAIVLRHDQNDLTFEYVGLDFANAHGIEYRIRLTSDGRESGWREVGAARTAVYPELPPGAYTFSVQAGNVAGAWSEASSDIHIRIQPPWWRSLWAYLLYILGLAGCFLTAALVQKRRLIARERAQSAERELEQAREIERAYRELKSTQAQLVQQEKMASLGALTAGIAHEIKNPLNFVNNFAEVNAELATEVRDALRAGNVEAAYESLADLEKNSLQIAKHGQRADSIVKSMMQHARGGDSKPEQIDVNTFVGEYLDLAWHGMRARDSGFRTEVIRDFSPDAGALSVLPQELGRVLLNLLNNAFDALRGLENGHVVVSTSRSESSVVITVSDNGPGIPLEIRDKIFEPFFTTKITGEGTGLGLSLSHDIVTQGHGGAMTVGVSSEGGAEFAVSLPC